MKGMDGNLRFNFRSLYRLRSKETRYCIFNTVVKQWTYIVYNFVQYHAASKIDYLHLKGHLLF